MKKQTENLKNITVQPGVSLGTNSSLANELMEQRRIEYGTKFFQTMRQYQRAQHFPLAKQENNAHVPIFATVAK